MFTTINIRNWYLAIQRFLSNLHGLKTQRRTGGTTTWHIDTCVIRKIDILSCTLYADAYGCSLTNGIVYPFSCSILCIGQKVILRKIHHNVNQIRYIADLSNAWSGTSESRYITIKEDSGRSTGVVTI